MMVPVVIRSKLASSHYVGENTPIITLKSLATALGPTKSATASYRNFIEISSDDSYSEENEDLYDHTQVVLSDNSRVDNSRCG